MKRITSLILVFGLIALLLAGCNGNKNTSANSADIEARTGKISVYTSFYPMYDFASKIGGDKIEIANLVPAGTEPHDWEPTAKDITNLEEANVFIYNGAGMENWVDKVLASIQNKNLIVVEASNGIRLIDGQAEAVAGIKTEQYDPHVWLSPMKAQQEMLNIKNALVKANPNNKAYYEANYEKYAAEFVALDKEFKDTLSPLTNKDIVVAHQAFGYLCADYGLNQIAIEGLAADSEPDPAKMSDIITFAKANNVKYIFFEELVSPKVAETVADAIGAKTEVLNPLEGLNDAEKAAGDDYFSVMRQNLQTLKSALQ